MFDVKSKVLCVNDSFPAGIHDYYNALPVKGTIYTVRDIVPAHDFKCRETCAVLLEELVNKPNRHGIEPAFLVHRFREPTQDEMEESIAERETATA